MTPYFPSLSWLTITDPERLSKFAEWGVVLLLFLIGLELSFERISTMRRLVFGLGGLQVLVSTAAIAIFAIEIGQTPTTAIVIGSALSLSSTAIVIEILARQKRLSTTVGRTSFSILLFQDLAVVPILLLVGILEPGSKQSLLVGILTALLQAAAALLIIIGVGAAFCCNRCFNSLHRHKTMTCSSRRRCSSPSARASFPRPPAFR